MKDHLPLLVAVIYAVVAIDHFWSKNMGWGIAWLSYSLANLGLVMASKGI